MKILFRISFVVILLLQVVMLGNSFPEVYALSDDELIWNKNHPLTWNDFQGTPETDKTEFGELPVGARSYHTVKMDWSFQQISSNPCAFYISEIKADAVFSKTHSWVIPEAKSSKSLLKHEQSHFDISKIHAGKFIRDNIFKEINCIGDTFDPILIDDRINQLRLNNFEENNSMNKIYDKDTKHGINSQEQQNWENKISELLGDYEIDSEFYLTKGLDLIQSKKYEFAIISLDKAIELNPNSQIAYHNIALSNYHLGLYNDAQKNIKKALQIMPDNEDSIKTRDAIIKLQQQITEEEYYSAYDLAKELSFKGDYENAIFQFKRVVDINPNEINSLKNIALLYALLGNGDLALKYAEKVLQIDSTHQIALEIKQRVLDRQEENKIKSEMNAVYDLATQMFENGDYHNAITQFKKIVNYDPQNIQVLTDIADSYYNLGDYATALIFVEQVLHIDSVNENALNLKQDLSSLDSMSDDLSASDEIPQWIKNNAKWWAEGTIDDDTFVSGIKFLIEQKVIVLPPTSGDVTSSSSSKIPDWLRNNASWWAKGVIPDSTFIPGIQYLIKTGVITIS